MKNYIIALLSSLWLGVAANGFGQGNILFQHSGSVNPTNEGFISGIGPGDSVGPLTNDLGMNAWKTATSGGALNYYQLLTQQQQAQVVGSDRVLSLTLRVAQSPSSVVDISALFDNGSRYFSLGFGLNGGGDTFVQAGDSLAPIYTLTGAGSSYNSYELVYNSANNAASLWVNGVDAIDNISGKSSSYFPGLYWGMGQDSGATYQANWSGISLLATPEPSAFCLIALGGGVLFYVRKRKRCRQCHQSECRA